MGGLLSDDSDLNLIERRGERYKRICNSSDDGPDQALNAPAPTWRGTL